MRPGANNVGAVLWLVDGMNVVAAGPPGWQRDRDRAMAELVAELETYVARTGDDVCVVFERRPRPLLRSPLVEIVHARRRGPDAGDFELVRRLRACQAPTTVCVVTSDRWLADAARALGAAVVSADHFRRRLAQV